MWVHLGSSMDTYSFVRRNKCTSPFFRSLGKIKMAALKSVLYGEKRT